MLHSGPRPRRNTSLYPYLAPLIWDTILVMEAWGQGEKRLDLGLGRRGGSPGGSGEVICLQCRRPRLGPQSGRSPGEGNDNPLRYSCLENSIDRGAWQATVHGGHKTSDTTEWLTLSLHFLCLKNCFHPSHKHTHHVIMRCHYYVFLA